jgi:methyl-accepting chemotaxis protein
MKTKPLLSRKIQLAFGSAILALLVVGVIAYRGMIATIESDRWVRHTHEVLDSLQDLLFATESIKSSYRGFALTGNESYLETYRAGISSAERDAATVRNLTLDNPDQQRRLSALGALSTQQIQVAGMVNTLRRAKGLETAAGAIQSGQGQRITDEIQTMVRELQDEERRLLALRDAEATQRLSQTNVVLILGTVLGLFGAAAAGWRVWRDSSGRALAEAALRESEEKYRMLIYGVQDYAIFMLDPVRRQHQ